MPQLALSWTWSADNKTLTLKLRPGVTFQDGEPFDAEAVKYNLDRYRTLPESLRKSEIASIDHVDAVDPLTVNLVLKQPDAALVAQLTDRSGMMMAPKATATGNPAADPVCSGPYKFVERVAQDRIVLDRFAAYWNAGAYHVDRVTFMPIPDTTVRLANLRSGGLDMIERMAATDVKTAEADPKLQVLSIPGLGFMSLEFNVTGPDARTPMGQDKRVRQAFDLAIDRDALNGAVYEGRYTPAYQPFAPASPYHIDRPVPGRDVEKSKALLKAAGVERARDGEDDGGQRHDGPADGAGDPGHDGGGGVRRPAADDGIRDPAGAGPGGHVPGADGGLVRPRRPGRQHPPVRHLQGRPQRHEILQPRGRRAAQRRPGVTDVAERKAKYAAAMAIIEDDKPITYLDFEPRIFGATAALHGFVPHPDGMIRLQNVTLDR